MDGNGLRYQRVLGDFSALTNAVKCYAVTTGSLPPERLGLQALLTRPEALAGTVAWQKLADEWPLDPWQRPYLYVADASLPDGFGVYSAGPDGVSVSLGNDVDDLASWQPSKMKSQANELNRAAFGGRMSVPGWSGFIAWVCAGTLIGFLVGWIVASARRTHWMRAQKPAS